MEPQFKLDNNGQEVQQGDFNTLGRTAALSGDIALQELYALRPALVSSGTVARGIVPLYDPGPVTGNGGTGQIRIYPFLAVLGSRNDAPTNDRSWKDIRSQIYVSETTLGAPWRDYPIASNSSGNTRWDLIYVTVSVDTDDSTVTRYVKNTTTFAVTATSVAVTKSTKLTIGTVTGTPAASPTFPALPADSGSNYNIPIAYIRVGNGFSGSTAVGKDEILEAPYVVRPSPRTGLGSCAPAAFCNNPSLPYLSTRDPWPATGTSRPRAYLPPSMQGKVERIIPIHIGAPANSIANGDVLDNTIDWRHRVFRWTVQFRGSRNLAWDNAASGSLIIPSATDASNVTFTGMGQSFTLDDTGDVARGSVVAAVGGTGSSAPVTSSIFGSTDKLLLYVDQDTGELKVFVSSLPASSAFLFWVEATGQYYNATYV